MKKFVSILLAALFVLAFAACGNNGGTPAGDKVTDPLVLRIVAYLKENYQSKITLADLQEQFHYSERYINQKFQKELGTTVIDYLNRCRIQNALELIRKGKLPISQIGWECGIGEYKYFNYVFKKYIGCSVREYQNTLK